MPIPFIPIIVGTLVGRRLPAIVQKVKDHFASKSVPAIPLDVNLPIDMQRDVMNLLTNVSNPEILQRMGSYYRNMGFPIAAGWISQKIEALKKG